MTLIELLTTMAILGLVMTAILGMFVSGLRAQVDLNQRFQAQQDARLALSTVRTDARTACTAAVPGGNTAVLGFCSDSSTTWSSTPIWYATWCARSEGGTPTHYGLYRETGPTSDAANCATATTGVREADWLTTASVFVLPSVSSGQRPQLQVNVPVDADPSTSGVGVYTLSDTVMLRNGAVSP